MVASVSTYLRPNGRLLTTPEFRTEEWHPGTATLVFWNILSIALAFLGLFVFGRIYTLTHGPGRSGELGIAPILISVVILLALLILHEWVHGLTMGRFGARPSYGGGIYRKVMPYFYCTAAGHTFTGSQFAAVSAAPALVISLVGVICVAFVPYGGWLVAPLGLHLAGCIGDLWFLALIFRQPQLTRFEDLKTGVRMFHPAA